MPRGTWTFGTRVSLLPVAAVVILLAGAMAVQAGAMAGQDGAQTPADLSRDLAARAAERIRVLQREADRLAAAARTVLNDLRRLEIERSIAQQQVVETAAALAAVTAERDAALARVTALEAERVANTPGLEERLVSIYKRGRGGYVRLLLSSEDPRSFGRLTRGVAAVATLDRVRVEAHRRTLAAERDALAEVDARRVDVAASQQAATGARTDLDRAVAAQNAAIDALDARRDLAAQYLGELQAARDALAGTAFESGGTAAALPFRPFRGDLDWPLTGRLLSRFGPSRDNRYGTTIVRNGIEIATTAGAEVRAVHGGRVAYAAPFAGFGTLVILDHGAEAFTLYGHLEEADVEGGQAIARGQNVGRAGTTPAGQPALYFEVRVDGRPVNPLQWLRSSP